MQYETIPGAPLAEILCRNELDQRPSRPPQDHLLDDAVRRLLREMTSSPASILQSLSETILDTLHCDSAGVSVINEDQTRFDWLAIAGVWKEHIGGGTPRHFGPCADVLSVDRPLHMRQVHKRYRYFSDVALVDETLLVPFYENLKAVGTIWAVIHQPPDNERSSKRNPPRFDLEDLRLLESLSGLASSAYSVWNGRTHIQR